MASTNKTTHYELSQYVSSDKPTYLVDYNGDMAKIDTGINTAKTTADTASTAATNAQTAAEGAQSTANTAVTNAAAADTKATTANTNIGTMANLNTTEKSSLVGAINEVNAKANDLETEIDNIVVDSLSVASTIKAPSITAVKNANSYSTNETLTGGTWINGKPIYRKVVNIGALPNNTVKTVSTGLDMSNCRVISIRGYAKSSSNYGTIPLPDVGFNQNPVQLQINTTGLIHIQTAVDYSAFSGYVVLEYYKEND